MFTRSLYERMQGAGDEVAIQLGDVLDADLLRAGRFALVDVGAVAEALPVVLGGHGADSLRALGPALRQAAEVAHLGREEQHRAGVRARGGARPATDAL